MLAGLKRALGLKDESSSPMWIDRPGARQRINSLQNLTLRTALNDLERDGIAIIRGNLSEEACQGVLDSFKNFCEMTPKHVDFMDGNGLHDRCCNLQIQYDAVRQVAVNPVVLKIIETAFEAEADIVGSLYFERGSEQDIHRDTPAFFTFPLNHYFGVWHALEDIHEDSGRLSYYPGGHRLVPDSGYVGSGWDNKEKYFSEIERACIDAKIDRVFLAAKKGDTVIWHPSLPHGGSPIKDSSRSRRSIVFHYKSFGLPIFGAAEFFGDQGSIKIKDIHPYEKMNGRRFLKHQSPLFLKNRKEGNFDNK